MPTRRRRGTRILRPSGKGEDSSRSACTPRTCRPSMVASDGPAIRLFLANYFLWGRGLRARRWAPNHGWRRIRADRTVSRTSGTGSVRRGWEASWSTGFGTRGTEAFRWDYEPDTCSRLVRQTGASMAAAFQTLLGHPFRDRLCECCWEEGGECSDRRYRKARNRRLLRASNPT